MVTKKTTVECNNPMGDKYTWNFIWKTVNAILARLYCERGEGEERQAP